MSKKILSIIGFTTLFIAVVYFYLKSKGKTSSSGTLEKTSGSEDALFSSQVDVKEEIADTGKMTAEEQLAYESKQAELAAARQRISDLRIEYANLYGKAAPLSATEAELQNAVEQQKKIFSLIEIYKKESGDTDLSDNDFTTEAKVQASIDSVRVEKEKAAEAVRVQQAQAAEAERQRLEGLKNEWTNRMSYIGGLVTQFISTFKDDGTALRTKAWNVNVQNAMNNLSDRDLVYAEKFFNSQRIRYHIVYGKDSIKDGVSIPTISFALNTSISYKRSGSSGWANMRGRLSSILQRYPVNANHIDEYGNLTH